MTRLGLAFPLIVSLSYQILAQKQPAAPVSPHPTACFPRYFPKGSSHCCRTGKDLYHVTPTGGIAHRVIGRACSMRDGSTQCDNGGGSLPKCDFGPCGVHSSWNRLWYAWNTFCSPSLYWSTSPYFFPSTATIVSLSGSTYSPSSPPYSSEQLCSIAKSRSSGDEKNTPADSRKSIHFRPAFDVQRLFAVPFWEICEVFGLQFWASCRKRLATVWEHLYPSPASPVTA